MQTAVKNIHSKKVKENPFVKALLLQQNIIKAVKEGKTVSRTNKKVRFVRPL